MKTSEQYSVVINYVEYFGDSKQSVTRSVILEVSVDYHKIAKRYAIKAYRNKSKIVKECGGDVTIKIVDENTSDAI